MRTVFGVSSVTPINETLKNGYTMFDWVMRQDGYPAFCMRTLIGEDKITAEEIAFLRGRHCKIGLVIRDLTEAKVSAVNGTQDALKAVKAARELGVPQDGRIALFAEIKPAWSVNHNWMISFAQTVVANGYVPGFIGNTDSSFNFNFDRQCSHFVNATKDVHSFGAVYMATEPKCFSWPEKWAPYCPSALKPGDISLWSCDTTTFDTMQVENVYARDENVLENMW